MSEMVARVRALYDARPIGFFFLHPSFILLLFLATATGFSNPMLVAAALLKASDIATKLWLAFRVGQTERDPAMATVMQQPLAPWTRWIGLATYPFLVYVALA
jgi:hypothetical protein